MSDRSTGAHSTLAVTGAPYSLPMLQYEVRVTRTLTQCFEPDAAGQPTTTPHVLFSAKVEATPKYVAGEVYLIDYRALSGFTKITSLAFANHETTGTLHTFNASAEDRSGQIIQSGVRTLTGIASLIAGIPPVAPVAGQEADRAMLACAPNTQPLVAAVADRTADLKTATTTLERVTERVNLLTEQARLNSISDAGRQELTGPGGLLEQQRAGARAVTSAQSRLERALQAVSHTVQIRWPRAFHEATENISLEDPGLGRLADLVRTIAYAPGPNGDENECGTTPGAAPAVIRTCLRTKLNVGLRLEQLGPVTAPTVLTENDPAVVNPATQARGIFIRPPVRGRLMACQLVEEAECSDRSNQVLLRTDDAVVPQLGQLRFLPFENEMFQNNAISLTLRTDGSIERLEYKEVSARGETLASTADSSVGQLRTLAQGLREARSAGEAAAVAELTAERSAALATLQFEIDRITREAQLNNLSNPPSMSQLSSVQAETALVNARVALLQALLAERTATTALANPPN